MKGWQKGYPEKKGWYRAVVKYNLSKEENIRHEFVEVLDTVADADHRYQVVGLEAAISYEDHRECEILYFWSEPELTFTIPYEQKYKDMAALERDIAILQDAMSEGNYGLVWNMVGREYHGETDEGEVRARIVAVEPAKGRIHVDRVSEGTKLPEYIKVNFQG